MAEDSAAVKGFRVFLVDGGDSEKRLCGTVTFPAFQKTRDLGTVMGHVLSFPDMPKGDLSLSEERGT